MDERPRPDLEQTREALRQHDERAEEPVEDEDQAEPGTDDSDEDDDESETTHSGA
jgi:hypothetical protein